MNKLTFGIIFHEYFCVQIQKTIDIYPMWCYNYYILIVLG